MRHRAVVTTLVAIAQFTMACGPEMHLAPKPPMPNDASILSRVVSDSDVPPRLLQQGKATYPPRAFLEKVEGLVSMQVVIDEQGRVAWWRITKSIPALDAAAVASLAEFRFEPAKRRGEAVAVYAVIPVTFYLK